MVAPEKLVTANAWIEVSVVCAVLLGTVMGGFLVSDWFTGSAGALAVRGVLADIAPHSGALGLSLLGVLALYAMAALLNLKIPDSGRRYGARWQSPRVMLTAFAADNRRVWRDHEGGLSLAVTTLFWGVGATLQFVVLRWAQLSLNLPLDQAAYLQGVVAVGVVGGAALAGWVVGIEQARRVLPLGIAMGLVVPWMSAVHSLEMAVVLLALVGALGGLFVVPMNALLQHRGAILLTAGRSIAVQGFNENLSVLLVLGLYTSLVAADLPMTTLLLGLGLGVAACIAALMWKKRGPVPTLAR